MLINQLKDSTMDALFQAMMSFESTDDFYALFDDLCTINELNLMKQRFHVALLLEDAKTYNEIQEKTGASSTTISRVKKCLDYGSGGYQKALDHLKKQDSKTLSTRKE